MITGFLVVRNIGFICIRWWRRTDRRTFSTQICTGVDETGGVSYVPCLSCLFFFFALLGCSLHKQPPPLAALSLCRTIVSSCEKAQFCLAPSKERTQSQSVNLQLHRGRLGFSETTVTQTAPPRSQQEESGLGESVFENKRDNTAVSCIA